MYSDFKLANYSNSLVSPELYARHLSRLLSGDVIDGLTVTPGTGLQVVLAPGNALIRYGTGAVASAREVSLVANFNLSIGTADVSNPRIDLVVLYVDNGVSLPGGTPTSSNLDGPGVAKAKIVQGTAASSPVAPNATAIQASVGAGNPYTVLAQVRVDAGVSVIASGKITDVRSMVYTTAKVASSNIDSATFNSGVDANGWNKTQTASGKTVWTKSGTVPGISLSAGIFFSNGAITSMPVGLTAANLYSSSYILTESLILDVTSRHVIPHTIFSNDTGTTISYGIINMYTGGSWTGALLYKYRIEQT